MESEALAIARVQRVPCARSSGSRPACVQKEGRGRAGNHIASMAKGEWHEPEPTDLLFPQWPRDLFNAILEEEKLRTDRDDRPRTAYSLRHTYICLRLLEGADIYQIAKNCRASVEMIEKYYAAHLKTQLNASAINIMRPVRRKRQFPRKAPVVWKLFA